MYFLFALNYCRNKKNTTDTNVYKENQEVEYEYVANIRC